jgi:XTP/dITP diphosphohydrolase
VELLIATGNAGKVKEFREMLGPAQFNWHDLSEFKDNQPVEETGDTFYANACLKASQYALRHGLWALADDSGLERLAGRDERPLGGNKWNRPG